VPPRQAPKTHPFFGTLFRVPDSHAFWRNSASGGESGLHALKSAAEFERFLKQVGNDLCSTSKQLQLSSLCPISRPVKAMRLRCEARVVRRRLRGQAEVCYGRFAS
jgi:hypothetical protein